MGQQFNTTWMASAIQIEARVASAQLEAAKAASAATQKARASTRAQKAANSLAAQKASAVALAKVGKALVRLAAKARKAAKKAARLEAVKASKAAKASAKAAKVARVVGAQAFAARKAATKAVKAAPGCKTRAAAEKVLAGLPTATQAFDAAFSLALAGKKVAATPKAPKGQGRRTKALKALAKAKASARLVLATVFGKALRQAQAAIAKAGRKVKALVEQLLAKFGPGAAHEADPGFGDPVEAVELRRGPAAGRVLEVDFSEVYVSEERDGGDCLVTFHSHGPDVVEVLMSTYEGKVLGHGVYARGQEAEPQVGWELLDSLEVYETPAPAKPKAEPVMDGGFQPRTASPKAGAQDNKTPDLAGAAPAAVKPIAPKEENMTQCVGDIIPEFTKGLRNVYRRLDRFGLTEALVNAGFRRGAHGTVVKGDVVVAETDLGVTINGNALRDRGVLVIHGPWEKEYGTRFQHEVVFKDAAVATLVLALAEADDVKLLTSLAHDITKGAVVEGLAYEAEKGRAAVVAVSVDYGANGVFTKPTKKDLCSARDALFKAGNVAVCNATFESVSVGNGALALSFGLVGGKGHVGFVVDKVHKTSNRLKLPAKATCRAADLFSSVGSVKMLGGAEVGLVGRKFDFVYVESIVAQLTQGLATVREWPYEPVLLDVDLVRKTKVDPETYDRAKAEARVVVVDAPEFSVGETVAVVDGVHQLVFTGPANTRLSKVKVFVDDHAVSTGFIQLGVQGVAADDAERQKFVAPGLKASVSKQTTFSSVAVNGREVSPETVVIHNDTVKDFGYFSFWAASEWAGTQGEAGTVYDPMAGYTEANRQLIEDYVAANTVPVSLLSYLPLEYLPLVEKAKAKFKGVDAVVEGDRICVVQDTVGICGSVVAPIEYSPTAASVNTSFMMPAVLGVLDGVDPELAKAFYNAKEAEKRRVAHKGLARMMAPATTGLPEGLELISVNTAWANDVLIQAVRAYQEEHGFGGFVLPQACDLVDMAAKAYPDGVIFRKVLNGQGAKDESFYVNFLSTSVLGGLTPGDDVSGFAEHVHTILAAAVLRGLGMDDSELSEVLGAGCNEALNEALNRISPALREANASRKFKTHIVGAKGYGRKVDTTAAFDVKPWTVHINPNDEVVVGTKLDKDGNSISGPIQDGEVVFIQRAPMFTLVPFQVVLNPDVPLGVARISALCWPPANEGDADGDGLTMFPLPANVVGERRQRLQDRMWAMHNSDVLSWRGYFLARGLAPELGNADSPYADDVLKVKGVVAKAQKPELGGVFEVGTGTADDLYLLQDKACNHLVQGVALTYSYPVVASHWAMLAQAEGWVQTASMLRKVTEWLMRICYEGWGLGGDYGAVDALTEYTTEGGVVPFEAPGYVKLMMPTLRKLVLAVKLVEKPVLGKDDAPDHSPLLGTTGSIHEFALLSSVLRRGGTHGGVSVHNRQKFLGKKAQPFPVEALLARMTAEEAAAKFGRGVVRQQMLETIPFQVAFAKALRDHRSAVVPAGVLETYVQSKGLKKGDVVTLTFKGLGGCTPKGEPAFQGGRLSLKGRPYLQAKAFAVGGTTDFVHVCGNGQVFDLAAGANFDVNVSLFNQEELVAAVKEAALSGTMVELRVQVTAHPEPSTDHRGQPKLKVTAKAVADGPDGGEALDLATIARLGKEAVAAGNVAEAARLRELYKKVRAGASVPAPAPVQELQQEKEAQATFNAEALRRVIGCLSARFADDLATPEAVDAYLATIVDAGKMAPQGGELQANLRKLYKLVKAMASGTGEWMDVSAAQEMVKAAHWDLEKARN